MGLLERLDWLLDGGTKEIGALPAFEDPLAAILGA
jgi:hypothetical protein